MKKTSKRTVYKRKKLGKKSIARIRRIKKLLMFVLLVTVIIMFARSSFFIVDEINVVGNKKYSSNDIIEQTGCVTGQNVFKMLGEKPKNLISFRFNESEKSIYESMPYIKSISVRPALPKTISIKIQERTPFAILETKGTSLLIDREGYALEILKATELKDKYFKIIGISVDSYKLGQEVKFTGRSPLDELTNFCDKLIKNDKDSKVKLYGKITSVNLSELNNITVYFDDRISVKFGDLEDIEYKIRFFKQLFVNNITAKQKGTLDFTKNNIPYFVPNE
ncbi:MAG: cell division protein FtsQ/DivIB [Ruminiclostridium sp.]